MHILECIYTSRADTTFKVGVGGGSDNCTRSARKGFTLLYLKNELKSTIGYHNTSTLAYLVMITILIIVCW